MAFKSSYLSFTGFSALLLLLPGVATCLTDPAFSDAELIAVVDSKLADPNARVSGLDAEQVYAVLVGEIAGRRGDMATAFLHYDRAARLTRSAQMAELAVRAAISGDDEAAAGRGVRLWLELAPDSAAAHQVAAFLRIKAKDREGALTHLVGLVELSEGAGESAYAQAAAIVARVPDPDTRVGLMQDLVGRFPESADAQQSLAMVAASASRFDVAERAARRALELRPDWNKPRLFLVRMLLSEGKRSEARLLLEGFVDRSPDDHALRMLYGQFLVEEQEFNTARDVFARLLHNRPKEPDVLFALGVLSLQLDDLDGAGIYFTRLHETGERLNDAAFYLGQTAERAEDFEAALDWYSKVKGANLAEALVRIAFLRAKAGEVAKAREILQQLRGRSPDEAVAFYLVEAEILDEVDRSDEAMDVYDTALEAFPGDLNLLYARALYAVELDRLELAERDLRRILDADPEHADALNALGYTLADRTDRYEEARGYIERAYALKPDEPAILDSMGWISYRLGDYERALDYLQRALEKMDDGEIAAHLGEVLWAMDRRAEAWEVWDRAVKAHPGHEYLERVVGRYRVFRTQVDQESARPMTPSKDKME